MSPSKPSGSAGQLSEHDDQVARKILDKLRENVYTLIDQEISATLPRKGKAARESSSVQPSLELYDDEGNLIFG